MGLSAVMHRIAVGWFRTGRNVCVTMLLVLAAAGPAVAAGGDVAWQAVDARSGKQQAIASAADSNGNVIVAGFQNLAGGVDDDFLTVKFRGDGSGVAWRTVFDKAGGSDQATAVTVDANNDVIVAGVVWNGINRDIQTVKYDGATGAVIWQQTFDGSAHGNDRATAVTIDSLNNVYVGGYAQNAGGTDDFLLLKYTPAGALGWQAVWNGPGSDIDQAYDVRAGSDGVAITGQTRNGSLFNMATVKYGFNGVKAWEKIYAPAGNAQGKKVRMDGSGNVVVTASAGNSTDLDIYTVKYSGATGGILWEQHYNGAYDDEPYALALDSGGDVYITGSTWTASGNSDIYTARYAAVTGALVWDRLFDSGNGNTDLATAIDVDPGGDLFVAGYTAAAGNYDILTLKYKRETGNLLWNRAFNGSGNGNERPVMIGLSPAGKPLVAGWTDNGTDLDYVVVSYDPGAINPPTNLVATTISGTSIRLDWADNSGNEEGFTLERKKGEGGTFAAIVTLGQNVTTHTDADPTLEANSYYYYRVRANSQVDGDSPYSNEAHALTLFVTFTTPAWSYLYNSPDNLADYANAIAVGPDNNPVVTGYSQRTVGGFDYFTVKLNRADKSRIWSDLYDDPDSEMDVAKCVAVDSANNAIVSGFSQLFYAPAQNNINSIYTIAYRYDTPVADPPAKSWSAQYNGPGAIDDRATAIATTTDAANNIVVIGYGKNAANNDDIYVVKYTANGTRAWAAAPFDAGADDIPASVAVAPDGSVYVTGYSETSPNAGRYNMFTAKYNGATGALVWSDVYGVVPGGTSQGKGLALDAAGDLYVAGLAGAAVGTTNIYTIKYSGAGSTAVRLWERAHVSAAGGDDAAVGVRVDPIDGAVVVAGTTLTGTDNHDVILLRYTGAGDLVTGWPVTLLRPVTDDHAAALTLDASGYIYLAATSISGATTDIFSVIYNFDGTLLGATQYNGTANGNDEASAIAVNARGEAFVAGYSTNAGGNPDYVVIKQTNGYLVVPSPFAAAAAADYSRMNLTWRDNSPGSTFFIERTLGPVTGASIWTPVAGTLAAGTTSYQDSGLNPGTSYCYRIEAVTGGFSSRKIIACGTTTLPAPTLNPLALVSATAVDVSWSAVSGASGYRLERSTDNSSWTLIGGTLAAGTLLYHDTGLTAGAVYYYRISTVSSVGVSLTSAVQIAPALNPPTGITWASVSLSWPPHAGITGFRLERSSDNSNWTQIATPAAAATSYADSSVAPATVYYYRLTALTANGGSAPSLVRTATTILATPTFNSATGVSTSQIDLSWSDVPAESGFTVWERACLASINQFDDGYCLSGYSWAWGAWTQVGSTLQGATSSSRTGLPAGKAYQYYVVATAGGGIVSAASTIRLAWTIPAASTLNTPTSTSDTSVVLTWNDVTGDNGYTVERKTGAGGSYASVATTPRHVTSYTDNGVTGLTTYYYRVKAIGVQAQSVYSNEQSITTPPAGPTVTALTAASTTNVTWGEIAGATGYEVQRRTFTYYDRPDLAGNAAYVSYWGGWSTVGTSITPGYTDSAVTAGYTYKYSVRAIVSGNYTGWGSDAGRYVTTVPPVPGGLTATGTGASQINLAWTNGYGETNYSVQYKQRSGADCAVEDWGTGVSTTPALSMNATSHAQAGLNTANAYCFRIMAYNGSGSSGWSTAVSYLPPPALNAPTGITQSQMTLSWSNVTGNTGYKVERSTDNATFSEIATRTANTVTYTDTGLTAGVTYYYRIRTLNGPNTSAPGNVVSAATQAIAPPALDPLSGITTSQMTLSWTNVPGSTGYKVDRSPDNTTWSSVAYPGAAATGYTDSGLQSGTRYYYRVSAKNSTGSYSVPSNVQSAATLLLTPVVAASVQNESRIDLSWQMTYGATSYKVLRSVGAGGPWTQVANQAAQTYTTSYCGNSLPTVGCLVLTADFTGYADTVLTENTQYCYQVKAWSSDSGDSSPSATVCQKTPAVGGPNLIAVTPLNSMKMQLDWSYNPAACSPVPCDTPDGFEIWRQLATGDWAQMDTVANVTSYTDTVGIEPLRSYAYKIRAYKGTDRSAFSNAAAATTPAYAVNDTTCNYRVTFGSSGPGSVIIIPAGANCGSGCYAYCTGAPVTFRAVADTGSSFLGWSGSCSGTSTSCTLTIDGDKTVTGSFQQ